MESPATALEVDDGSVDVVAIRSVLIYVEDKRRAFHELHRVLRRGGRLSLFEPINRFDERDLLTLAADAGFFPVTLDYRARIEPPEPRGHGRVADGR